MIIVVDNQSVFTARLSEYLKESEVPHIVLPHDANVATSIFDCSTGIILSGGQRIPESTRKYRNNFLALTHANNVPILGLCLGMQLIARHYGVTRTRLAEREKGYCHVHIVREDSLFDGLPQTIRVRKRHKFHIEALPDDFTLLAESDACPIEAFRHNSRHIYGIQAHPEAGGEHGKTVIKNFLSLCEAA